MQSGIRPASLSPIRLWAGRIISALPVLILLFSGAMKVIQRAEVLKEFARLGYQDSHVLAIGIVEIACTVLYIIPNTSVLGAILLTGYLGGATATHVRISDPFIYPIIFGVFLWAGLYLRDSRVSELIPLRR